MSETVRSGPVVIVGGGLSGLAAAVELCVHKIPVLLLEQKPFLGGRAYSFRDDTTGTIVDNGQHALLAGYDRTFQFLRRVGADALVTVQRRATLMLHHPDRGFVAVRFPRLPSPFHLAWGIVSGSLFAGSEKAAMLRAGWSILRSTNRRRQAELEGKTIDQWLDQVGQPMEVRRSFWEPLAVSIMNEHLAQASAGVFVHALRTAFLGGWEKAALAIPSVGLSELFVDPARRFIESHGGEVRCSVRVEQLLSNQQTVKAVRIGSGDELECRGAILAVPPTRVEGLLPDEVRTSGFLRGASTLPMSPIVSIHLWFTDDFMKHSMLGIVGGRVQWVFKKSGYVSAVISAARGFVDRSHEELVNIAQEDLESVFGSEIGKPYHTLVIRERRATFSATPAVEHERPTARTPLSNLVLAGDWTATGYPATIEGAVMSGHTAAHLLLTSQLHVS